MTGKMIEMIEEILISLDIDYVIVYGDTNSTLAGSIASKKLGKKIVHVEAGVRNNDKFMPEEINRIITDRISDLLFCSSTESYINLVNEGYKKLDCKFENVGDIMFENISQANISESLLNDSAKILFTCHRQNNL
jgi:UDP-GlcNAc3NAcA epimerase